METDSLEVSIEVEDNSQGLHKLNGLFHLSKLNEENKL